MDLDKNLEPIKIDDSCIETAIFALFKINIVEHIRLKASLTKQFHLSPQSIDELPYWEFELYLKLLNQMVKEENDAQKSEMDKYHVNNYSKIANPSRSSFKMPSMNDLGSGNFKLPKF